MIEEVEEARLELAKEAAHTACHYLNEVVVDLLDRVQGINPADRIKAYDGEEFLVRAVVVGSHLVTFVSGSGLKVIEKSRIIPLGK